MPPPGAQQEASEASHSLTPWNYNYIETAILSLFIAWLISTRSQAAAMFTRNTTLSKQKAGASFLNASILFMSVLGDEAQVSPIHSATFLSCHVILSLYRKQNISKMQGVGLQRWLRSQECLLLLQKTQIQFLAPMGHESQLPVAPSPEDLIPFSVRHRCMN